MSVGLILFGIADFVTGGVMGGFWSFFPRLMVVEGDRLLGIVTLKDLLEFLSSKVDLEESPVRV